MCAWYKSHDLPCISGLVKWMCLYTELEFAVHIQISEIYLSVQESDFAMHIWIIKLCTRSWLIYMMGSHSSFYFSPFFYIMSFCALSRNLYREAISAWPICPVGRPDMWITPTPTPLHTSTDWALKIIIICSHGWYFFSWCKCFTFFQSQFQTFGTRSYTWQGIITFVKSKQFHQSRQFRLFEENTLYYVNIISFHLSTFGNQWQSYCQPFHIILFMLVALHGIGLCWSCKHPTQSNIGRHHHSPLQVHFLLLGWSSQRCLQLMHLHQHPHQSVKPTWNTIHRWRSEHTATTLTYTGAIYWA